ncbi:hypothetical protein Droror1_Dr00022847 [Drosera rotundifolia]
MEFGFKTTKIKSNKFLTLCLGCSIIVNVYLLSLDKLDHEVSWSRSAAEEAEAVALISCSGHGSAFLDGLVVDGKPVCECNACYTGPDCSILSPDGCVADANSGDPFFLEPFWKQRAASSAMVVAGWHRMSYSFDDGRFISSELEKVILRIHAIVRNAVTQDKYIVFGGGSTQLLNAAVHALSASNSTSSVARVVASIPFYPAYQTQTDYFRSDKYRFEGDTASFKNNISDNADTIVEFVTSPNNPDGLLQKSAFEDERSNASSHRWNNIKSIHDHAYYWPHFTAIPAPADEDLMIFTLSKLTGHAGTRFGWALIKDEAVYQRMQEYVEMNVMGVPRETQLRAWKLLNVVKEDGCRVLFDFGYTTMRTRWEELNKALLSSNRFSIQEIPPMLCTFFGTSRGPSPAYAWLRCNWKEDEDCYGVLNSAGIIGRDGSKFGVEKVYVRLSLIKSQDDFDLLLRQIKILVSNEHGNQASVKPL